MPKLLNKRGENCSPTFTYTASRGSVMSSCRKSVWCECKSTALICGNKMLPVQLGRPAASQSCCQNNERNRSRTSWLISGLKWEKERAARRLFLFLCPDRKQNNGCFGKWGSSWNSPSCRRARALGGSRVQSRKSLGRVRARREVRDRHEEGSLCSNFVVPCEAT